jgi:hypothetical protein
MIGKVGAGVHDTIGLEAGGPGHGRNALAHAGGPRKEDPIRLDRQAIT